MMKTCYVCLESCEEVSPCECRLSLHTQCMHDMRKHMRTETCTICKAPIRIEWVQFPNIEPPNVLIVEEPGHNYGHNYGCITFYLFFSYCMLGWIGKCVMFVLGVKITNFVAFWTSEHFLCTVPILLITGCLHRMLNRTHTVNRFHFF